MNFNFYIGLPRERVRSEKLERTKLAYISRACRDAVGTYGRMAPMAVNGGVR